MQSINHPVYTYDALGRLVNYTPSGATNDVVADHILLDPRIAGPRSLVAGGLVPVQVQVDQFNQQLKSSLIPQHLFVPPLSMTSPPVSRPKTDATNLGYSSFDKIPESRDVYSITTAAPIIDVPHDSATKRVIR